MIGKIKKFNFESLFILNTFALIVTSYFFNNFIFAGVYILFFVISIFTTKNGLKINKKCNLLQNIRNEGPANHFKKSDTPTRFKVKLFNLPNHLLMKDLLQFYNLPFPPLALKALLLL